jgi:hypothetical protein
MFCRSDPSNPEIVMTRKIAAVDPQSLQDVLKQTHGDALSRMQQAAAILIRQGVEPAGMEALLQRIRALSELLGERPGLTDSYSVKALTAAGALCELIEPPMSLAEPDQAVFDLEKFAQEASRAEL